MKKFAFLLIGIVLLACKSNDKKETTEEEVTSSEEIVTNEVVDGLNTLVPDPEEEGTMMLLGKIDRTGLGLELFQEWYQESKKTHSLDSTAVSQIKPLLENVSITVFMGTWCEDSQREVPALFKILDAAAFDDEQIEMFAVSRDKDTPQEYEKKKNIEYVPSIIFMKDGKELNRIVEYAQTTLEQDMLTILKGEPYKHAYAE